MDDFYSWCPWVKRSLRLLRVTCILPVTPLDKIVNAALERIEKKKGKSGITLLSIS